MVFGVKDLRILSEGLKTSLMSIINNTLFYNVLRARSQKFWLGKSDDIQSEAQAYMTKVISK